MVANRPLGLENVEGEFRIRSSGKSELRMGIEDE
jgi:hypothetical protein